MSRTTSKACTKCKQAKDIEAFGRCAKMGDGRKSVCRECRKVESAEYRSRPEVVQQRIISGRNYRSRNRERHNNYNRAWNVTEVGRERKRLSECKRRAIKSNLPHEDYTKAQIIERDGPSCWICGIEGEMEIEHLIAFKTPEIALLRWGLLNPGDVLANVALSCRTCNSRKFTHLLVCAVARYYRNLRVDGSGRLG